jgi:hypothetical protein
MIFRSLLEVGLHKRRVFQGCVSLMLLIACMGSACAPHFRMERSVIAGSPNGPVRLSCEGNPRRFAAMSAGVLQPIGDIAIACIDGTAACEADKDKGFLQVAQGAWVEVTAKPLRASGYSTGAICLKRTGWWSSDCSDDDFLLDFIVECSRAVEQKPAGQEPSAALSSCQPRANDTHCLPL